MKKAHFTILVALICVLITVITIPALAVDIEALINLYISDPTTATYQLLDLIETDPDAVALVLAGVAERIAGLEPTDPDRATLVGRIQGFCIALIDTNPTLTARIAATIKEEVPEIGEGIEQALVGAGLEESYLRAASPVRP